MARKKYRLGKVVDLDEVVKREKSALREVKIACRSCGGYITFEEELFGNSVVFTECPRCGVLRTYDLSGIK